MSAATARDLLAAVRAAGGFVHSTVAVRGGDGGDDASRRLVTTAAVSAAEDALRIPREMLLTGAAAGRCAALRPLLQSISDAPAPAIIGTGDDEQDAKDTAKEIQHVRLILLLAHLKHDPSHRCDETGATFVWYAYARHLHEPTGPSRTMTVVGALNRDPFAERTRALHWIAATPVLGAAQDELLRLDAAMEKYLPEDVMNAATQGGVLPSGRAALRELLVWAHEVVESRAFEVRLEETQASTALVPMLDLADHVSKDPVLRSHGLKDARNLIAVFERDVSEGTHDVTLTYRPALDNGSLLLRYGFALKDNPAERLAFSVSLDDDEDMDGGDDEMLRLRKELLIDVVGFDHDVPANGVPNDDLLIALRVSVSSAEELEDVTLQNLRQRMGCKEEPLKDGWQSREMRVIDAVESLAQITLQGLVDNELRDDIQAAAIGEGRDAFERYAAIYVQGLCDIARRVILWCDDCRKMKKISL